MATAQAGYSGTPLPTKLGLKDGQRVGFVCLPESLVALTEAAIFVKLEQASKWAALDLVDVKVCAGNEIWSGLKSVIGKERGIYD